MKGSWPRVVDLDAGTAMIVTDLHGDWEVYQRYRDRFLDLHAQGLADYLILTGDLIHHSGPEEQDSSLQMVLDMLDLRVELGPQLVYLLGNHEMPHIYSITLQKGDYLFTPRFEAALGEHRNRVLTYFDELPFFVRSRAGVAFCHAGASALFDQTRRYVRLFDFSHQALLEQIRNLISVEELRHLRRELGQRHHTSYDQLAREYIAVCGPGDPRYDDFLIGTMIASTQSDFELLWQLLFSRNELQYGRDYPEIVRRQLAALSTGSKRQNVLVSGHMDCRGGYTVVTDQQFRLASAKNAHPLEEGNYLLLDLEKPVGQAQELASGLGSVFK